jgi:hypothetical protein
MSDIRTASRTDLPRLTEIYNHYVVHTSVTFDVEPYSVESRAVWFDQFSESGCYRLLGGRGSRGCRLCGDNAISAQSGLRNYSRSDSLLRARNGRQRHWHAPVLSSI